MSGSDNTYSAAEQTIPPDILQLMLRMDMRLSRLEELLQEQQRVREYYSTAEAAAFLGKAEFTVREWCRLGRIHSQKKHSGRGEHQAWVISHEELLRVQREGLLPL